MKKAAALNAGLVAVKGAAAPASDVPTRSPEAPPAPKPRNDTPLNFKMSSEFTKAFKRVAVDEGLKLNELLEKIFAAYVEKGNGHDR